MKDIEHWYIGHICEALDNSGLPYHHCRTWFRLFPDEEKNTCSIEGVKNDDDTREVVVYKGKTFSWRSPVVFRGTLQEFETYLLNFK